MSSEIVARVEALEHRLRRWRQAFWGLGALVVVGVTVAASLPRQQVVRCERLEVVGLGGNVAVSLGTTPSGDGVMVISDGSGREVLRIPAGKQAGALPFLKRSERSGSLIQSRILGTFRGFASGRIFELENGELWEQVSNEISIAVRLRPKVTLYKSAKGWTMHVEGELRPVLVKSIR